MRVVVQRVNDAYCKIDGKIISEIQKGFMLLVGFTEGDTLETCAKLAKKIQGLRICADETGKINKSLKDTNGKILSISQFTLYANLNGGYRPSFIEALNYEEANKLYLEFNKMLRSYDLEVLEGVFGADMEIGLKNMGPTTIIVDSRDLK